MYEYVVLGVTLMAILNGAKYAQQLQKPLKKNSGSFNKILLFLNTLLNDF